MNSIWGDGDKETIIFLNNTKIKGKWLELACGDGRYTLKLLKKVDYLVASDYDRDSLKILEKNISNEMFSKIEIVNFDITKIFPFEDNSFDGIFCTGTLHLFSQKKLNSIFLEINRILKNKGKIIIDFAIDIKRILPNGKLFIFKKEPLYNLEGALKILKKNFINYKVNYKISNVPTEKIILDNKITYDFSCNFILLTAEKCYS